MQKMMLLYFSFEVAVAEEGAPTGCWYFPTLFFLVTTMQILISTMQTLYIR